MRLSIVYRQWWLRFHYPDTGLFHFQLCKSIGRKSKDVSGDNKSLTGSHKNKWMNWIRII